MTRQPTVELTVALAGLFLIGAAFVLYGPAPLPFFAGYLGLFTILGVFVARDARALGQHALSWGLATVVFGPFAVTLYVWYRAGYQAAGRRPHQGGAP